MIRTAKLSAIVISIILYATFCYAANLTPKVGTITPSSGSTYINTPASFTTTYTDADGYLNITQAKLIINKSATGVNGFYGYYDCVANKIYIYDDVGTTALGGYAPGSANIIENSYVKLDCASTTVSGTGTTLAIKWAVTFKPPFTGAKSFYLYVKDVAGLYAGWTKVGVWTITNRAPVVGTITPSSGSTYINTPALFITTYTDADGYANITQAKLIINTSAAGARGFYGYYDCVANKVYMYDDAGTTAIGGYAPGSANIIENSYVKLDCASTTVSGTGTTLAIKWAVTFKSSFTGAKNSYLYVKDTPGSYAGWTKVGTWTITNRAPAVGVITPSSGTSVANITTPFTVTYTDADGYANITQAKFIINTSATGVNGFYGYYDCAANKIYIYDDTGATAIGGYAPGSANIIENSYVKLDCASTTVSGTGTTLAIKWAVTFKSSFTGAENSYLYVKDTPGSYAGWTKVGTWTIANRAPAVGTVTPSTGTSDANQMTHFITTYTDADGYLNIAQARLIINASVTGTNGFYGYYNRLANKIYIYDDTGATAIGGYAPGSANIIENSYVKLDCASTTVSGTGTTLAIKWAVTFKSSFTGAENSYLYVKDTPGSYAGWTKVGTWTIANRAPAVGTVTPSSGASDPNQKVSLAATYVDADGYRNLTQAKIIINTSAIGKNSFYGYYDCVAKKVYLYNDAGTTAIGGYAPGSANIIENSYVKLDCASTVVSGSGDTLIINWVIIFKPSFVGSKNIYLYASDSSASSGFIHKGTWSVSTNPADSPPIITTSLISSINGAASNNMLGYFVMQIRNISGDGLDGIVVSAPGISTGTDIGRAYVYFGSDITKNPDLILTGLSSGGCFGYSMASGDVNGDGYGDIIIGEPYNDENGVNSGKVYVYFGGPALSNCPNVIMKGQKAGDLFGYSIACGELNKDNCSDIVVSAPYNTTNTGKVHLYYGGQAMTGVSDVILTGPTTGDLFGYAVTIANNMDGNNNSGIIVGSPGLSSNVDRPGKVFVYFVTNAVNSIADLVMTGEANGNLFGCSVSSGDFDGDGSGDFVVGAERNSAIAANLGRAYIFLSSKGIASPRSLCITGELAGDRFGHLVSCVGDLNGDGFSDLVVGSPANTNSTGKIYLYFGGLFMDNAAEASIKGEAVNNNFGSWVSSAGDMNNDGAEELLIGASNNSANGTNSGKGYIYKVICSGQPIRSADALIDETEAKACKYFYEQILTDTASYGLVKDTCYSDYSSIAATGFGLTALCIMADRAGSTANWAVTRAQASERVSATLDTIINIQNNQIGNEDYYGKEGFLFRSIGNDGKRETSVISDVSTADTALLLAGVLTAGKYFGGDIQLKANEIFNNVAWSYFLDSSDEQFYYGWNPESGITQQTWNRLSDETLLISILSIASDPSNQEFLKSYYGFVRNRNTYESPAGTFDMYSSYSGSMSTYILAHCWYDFKDAGADMPQKVQGAKFPVSVNWWENSKIAAQANRQFCIDNALAYSSYSANDWGLSACLRPDRSYFGMNGAAPREYVAPDGGEPANDGTVPPYGAISTLPLMKDFETSGLSSNLAYQALAHYYNDYYFRLWGPYGPRDSFNQIKKFSTIYTGVNLGQMALMIENYRSGFIWNTFMQDSKVAQIKGVLFADTVPPVISLFTVSDTTSPTPGYSHTVNVSVCIDGNDSTGVAKWLITETSSQPSVADFNSNGSVLKPVSFNVSAGNGMKTLYAWAMDNCNNMSCLTANSQAQIYLDATSPAMGAIVLDSTTATSISQLHASWTGQDAESGVIEYQYSITDSSPNGSMIRNWTSAGVSKEITAMGLPLIKNHTYYFNVKCRNATGLWSNINSSNGIALVQSAPMISTIMPGDGSMSEVGSVIVFNVNAADLEGDAIQYKIAVDGHVVRDWGVAPSFSWQTTLQSSGIRQITVSVKDIWGNESCSNASIYLVRKTFNIPA